MRTVSVAAAAQLRHRWLGNANMRVVNVMIKGRRYDMLPFDVAKTQDCLSCAHAKHTRRRCKGNPVMNSKTITSHKDIYDPMRTTSCRANKYFLAMTTREPKYVRINFLKNRSSVKGYFDHFLNWIERHQARKLVEYKLTTHRSLPRWEGSYGS